jgi:uncharacterized protein YoxC
MGLAEYVTSRSKDPADLLERLRTAVKDAAAAVSEAATLVDGLATRCEQHQAQEDDERQQSVMEQSIQKYGGLSRDLWAMHTKLRRMATGTLHRVVQEDARLREGA